MKKFAIGFLCGAVISVSTVAYASDTVSVYLFPSKFEFNGQSKAMDNEYAVLNYNGHAYAPIRFIAENMGANIDYDDNTKTIIVKNGKPDIADPNSKDIAVGNLILIGDGSTTKVSGQIEIDLPGTNLVAADLLFYNDKDELIGTIAINGAFNQGVQIFNAVGKGDFANYSKAKLRVNTLNNRPVSAAGAE